MRDALKFQPISNQDCIMIAAEIGTLAWLLEDDPACTEDRVQSNLQWLTWLRSKKRREWEAAEKTERRKRKIAKWQRETEREE